MLSNINYQIWFKVCRPLKRKYNLSTNCVLVLNGAYVLYMTTHKGFTLRSLQNFASYYSPVKIKGYIRVLVDRSFITLAGAWKTRQLYTISELGIQVIKELNESYQEQLIIFCNKYNIEL